MSNTPAAAPQTEPQTKPIETTPTTSAPTSRGKAPPTNQPVVATNVAYDPWQQAVAADKGQVIIGADPQFDYRWTPAKDYAANGAALEEWRNRLAARQFEPCNGPRFKGVSRGEHHVSEPTMEIWRRPLKLADEEFLAREVYPLILKPEFNEYYKAYPGAAGRAPSLPVKLRDAMDAFHTKGPLPNGKPKPTTQNLRNLVKKVPVHPGTPEDSDTWD